MASIEYRTRAGLAELQQAHDAVVTELEAAGIPSTALERVWTAIRRYAEAKVELALIEPDRRQEVARQAEESRKAQGLG